jgi:small subunit ribosomal protein S1
METDTINNGTLREDQSFEAMLAESFTGNRKFKPGQKVKAKIVTITNEWVFIDLGGKSEGILDRLEMIDEKGTLTVREGDMIEAFFLSVKNHETLFTTKLETGEAGRNYLEEAWQNAIPVEGLIENEIKGGYEVKLAGNLKGFCPFSQMGIKRRNDATDHVGKRLTFKILEYGEKGRNIILSRKVIEEEELQKKREFLQETLREGMSVKGIVTSIQKFGAFLDIEGATGLIPISEISWNQVVNIKDFLSVGQEVEAVVMKLDWENDRLSFSIKKTLPDPWEKVLEKYSEGMQYTGIISHLAKFGAFVTLEDGIEGLIHISRLGEGKKINHPGELLKQGETITVHIEKIDKDQRKMSLVTIEFADAKKTEEDDDYRGYLGKRGASMGTLGDLLKHKIRLSKR